MKDIHGKILTIGLISAILISNAGGFIRDGKALDGLRGSVLRLHILAESDSERDQRLKIMVRDELLRSGIFDGAENLTQAEDIAAGELGHIEQIAGGVLRANGCKLPVKAELTDMWFDDRTYGDITMPAGNYRAVRVSIGSASGHNWWCVMYPPLCLPAVSTVPEKSDKTAASDPDVNADEEEKTICDDPTGEQLFFSRKELDIMKRPRKYRVRFAVWDKLKEITEDSIVQNDENIAGS